MTIKKPMKTVKPTLAPTSGAEAAPAAGGAAIADRFKLEPTAPDAKAKAGGGTVNKKAAMIALIAGVLGLCASGGLVYLLYQHWQFLMPA